MVIFTTYESKIKGKSQNTNPGQKEKRFSDKSALCRLQEKRTNDFLPERERKKERDCNLYCKWIIQVFHYNFPSPVAPKRPQRLLHRKRDFFRQFREEHFSDGIQLFCLINVLASFGTIWRRVCLYCFLYVQQGSSIAKTK